MVLLSNGELILEDETPRFFQNMPLLLEKSVYPPGALLFFYELMVAGYSNHQLPLTLDEAEKKLKDLIKNRTLQGEQQ
jgi:hypothetical protein